jgi:hypothetical protein
MRWILLMAMASTACCCAETIGYRFVAEPNTRTPICECPVLAQAPAATPFAGAGDELRDLTALARAEKIPLENGWALWNQTRKLLVVRGPLVDQWRIADRFGFDAQRRQVKVTVEWLRAKEPTAVPTEPAFAALGMLGFSGMKSNASMTLKKPDGRWKFSTDVEPIASDDGMMDILITAKWQGPGVGGTQYGSITTSVVIADGKPCPVAGWYAVGRGDAWWLRLKADLLLADGTCWRDALLRQVGDAAQPWPTFTPTAPDGTLPDVRGWQMRVRPIARDMIQAIVLGPDEGDDIDPFSTPDIGSEYPKFGLPEAAIPEALKDLAAPGMLNMREFYFKALGPLSADVFLAYDPISQRMVFGSKDPVVFDQIESLFLTMDDRWSSSNSPKYETWLFDAATPTEPWMKISLVGKLGMKSVLEWRGRNHRPFVRLENVLNVIEDDSFEQTSDLRCRMKPPATTALNWHAQAVTGLVPGVTLLTDALKLPDGRTLRQGQRASLIQMRAE